jgi:hypothetical protein
MKQANHEKASVFFFKLADIKRSLVLLHRGTKTAYSVINLKNGAYHIFIPLTKFTSIIIIFYNIYCIREEIKNRLIPGNACYHPVKNLLSSCLLSKNIKIKIYKTIILLVVLYGYETWSLIKRENTD